MFYGGIIVFEEILSLFILLPLSTSALNVK
jgi:hypothetical protein